MKLVLRAKSGNWEIFDQRRKNRKFQLVRQELTKRDKFTCQYCHFKSAHLEVTNVDNDFQHNRVGNMASCCILCARCNLLDSYKIDYSGEDKVIYLPELSQEQLNHLIRSLFIKMVKGEEEESYNARRIFSQLQDRATWLDEQTGVQLSHPALFVHYLDTEGHDNKLVQRLRWLPALSTFKEYVPVWLKQYQADLDLLARQQ